MATLKRRESSAMSMRGEADDRVSMNAVSKEPDVRRKVKRVNRSLRRAVGLLIDWVLLFFGQETDRPGPRKNSRFGWRQYSEPEHKGKRAVWHHFVAMQIDG